MTAIKQLFLCHYSGDAEEVAFLARELRLRGVVPWRDRDGGFSIGDENSAEARRAIHEDCFGLAFYATRKAFERAFIRDVEIPAAIRCKEEDPSYVLFALPRRMGWVRLKELSVQSFGVDLSTYNSRAVKSSYKGMVGAEALKGQLALVAREVLGKVLARSSGVREEGVLRLQCSTRERLADEPGDVLRIDAVELLAGSNQSAEAWEEFRLALLDVKQRVSEQIGRPRLRVHGSKHLTAAFALGYTFPATVTELEIRTRQGYWQTDCVPASGDVLRSRVRGGAVGSTKLYLELGVTGLPVAESVRQYVGRTGEVPTAYLVMEPIGGSAYQMEMDNAAACSVARQVRRDLAHALEQHPAREIHLFAAVPQGVAAMIGRELGAMPPVQLYEFDGIQYRPSLLLKPR